MFIITKIVQLFHQNFPNLFPLSHHINDEFAQFDYFQYFLLLQNLSPYAQLNGSIFFTRSTCLLSPKFGLQIPLV